MGIDNLEETFWKRNISPYIQESEFAEEHPWITGMTEHIGGGISDFLTQKIPDFYNRYNLPDTDPNQVSPIVPIGKWAGNLLSEGARYGTDIGLAAVMEAPHLPYQLYNWNAAMGNQLVDWGGGLAKWATPDLMDKAIDKGVESLQTDILPGHGWRGTGTLWKDTASDLTRGYLDTSGMREEAATQADKYGGWYYDDALKTEDNPKGAALHLNLNNWGVYQSWKDGSGKDFNAMDREVKKQTDKDIDKWLKNEGSLDQLNKDFREHVWAPLSDADKQKYDYNESFKGYYNGRLAQEKGWYNNYNEFSKTGQDYANWSSKEYRDDFISKYGRYPLEDFWGPQGAGDMKFDVSPFEGLTADFNLANKDYVDAIAEGRTKHGIGSPKEFDYGIFDKEKGVGISEWGWDSPLNWSFEEPFEYETEEAKALAHSGPVTAAEFILAGKGAGKFFSSPMVEKFLHGTKTGRVTRETLPGLTHHNPGFFKMRKDFGFPKFEKVRTDSNWKKLGKGSVNVLTTAVDWARPKGFQMGIGIAGGERKNRQWQE
jgi:hypothetical protein